VTSAPREPIVSGVVQCGASRFVVDKTDATSIHYRVVAPVLDTWGNLAVPGAWYEHTAGIAPASEGVEAVERRQTYAAGIYGFRGYLSEWEELYVPLNRGPCSLVPQAPALSMDLDPCDDEECHAGIDGGCGACGSCDPLWWCAMYHALDMRDERCSKGSNE
jgi:hypothetical protein